MGKRFVFFILISILLLSLVSAEQVVFDSSGSWTVPANVNQITVELVGGGGGGGAANCF